MDASRLGRGRLIAAIAGAALIIIMFLPWFGLGGEAADAIEEAQQIAEQFGAPTEEADTDANAWQAFGFIDLVLIVAALVAIGLAVASLSGATGVPPAASAVVAGLGALATLLVLFRLIDPPDVFGSFPDVPGFEIEVSRKIGVFLGLIASAAVAVGGWLAMQEEGATVGRPGGPAGGPGGPAGDPGAPPPPPPPGGTGAGAETPTPPPPPRAGP